MGRDSSVDVATRYGMDGRISNPDWWKIFHQNAITRRKNQQNAITLGWNPRNCSNTVLKFTKLPLHEVKSNKMP
jgi:hypothetical protein